MPPADKNPPPPTASEPSVTGTYDRGILEQIAREFRRMRADETYDDDGIRTIWHRGPQRTELLTWEDRKGNILKQELSFVGLFVETSPGMMPKTGVFPVHEHTTDTGQPRSSIVEITSEPDPSTIRTAAQLLGWVPVRDKYSQLLLDSLTLHLASLATGATPTDRTDRNLADSRPAVASTSASPPTAAPSRSAFTVLLVSILGIALGILLGLFLFT